MCSLEMSLFLCDYISICISMGSSEIWDKYHECCFGNGTNFTRQSRVKLPISNVTRVVFIPNIYCYTHADPCYNHIR